ncbi:SPOR domain-containing protein [Asaia sp. HN010]|uniref:SPOR domain-containing protein n=1 Tax=Asaia sp. HN010 TaxID=3081233 RepID=UPI00301610D4
MNDDTPDWRDDRQGGDERPRQPGGNDRRANDPRFTDTRPPSYGAEASSARDNPRASSPRERLSADYDDEPVFRRRAATGGGLGALLGSDVMTRRLVYGAAGLGALLVVGVGGWSLLGGHSGGIPVIGPPPGPVRDRPADPGGMQIMGDGTDLDVTGQGEAHLAPEPEQPRPEALAARTAPETPSAPPAAREAPAASPSDSPSGSPSGSTAEAQKPEAPAAASPVAPEEKPAEPAPRKPEETRPEPKAVAPPKTDEAKPATVPSPVTTGKTESGGHMVQLAALGSDADAKATWSKLSRQASDLLSSHESVIEQKTINGHVFYRLRIGGFESAQAARAFCVRLHARSIACTPAVF